MKYRVYITNISTDYLDETPIKSAIQEGMLYTGASLALEKAPKVLIKSSLLAHDKKTFSKHAYVHPTVFNQSLQNIHKNAQHSPLEVFFERTPFGELKKSDFLELGYNSLFNLGSTVRWTNLDSKPNAKFLLSKHVHTSSSIVRAPKEYGNDYYKVILTKLHMDVTSNGFSGAIRALKENVDDFYNETELVDYLQIFNPQLVISDAIQVPQGGSRYFQNAQELGAIIIANNALAHDLVACELMQFDPMKIPHLKLAIENEWGPHGLHDIEIGGIGHKGLKTLHSKTKLWMINAFPFKDFNKKIELENSGYRFPLEIITQPADAYDFLMHDTLNMMFLSAKKKTQFHRWPSTTLCIGHFRTYPKMDYVFLLGHAACKSFEYFISKKWTFLHWKDFSFSRCLLKNGEKKWAFEINSAPQTKVSTMALAWSLFIGSFGKIRMPCLNPRVLYKIFLMKTKMRFNQKKQDNLQLIMTSEMPQNEWWSLRRFQQTR